jgi:predicted GIY-YIG superfamily endonuclease
MAEGFTKRYRVHSLVYAKFHATMAEAIVREKHIKKWRRAWKIALIEEAKPGLARPLRDGNCLARIPFDGNRSTRHPRASGDP